MGILGNNCYWLDEFPPGVQIESLSPHGYSIRRCYGHLRMTFSGRLLGADKVDCVCSLWIGWF